MKGFVTTSVTLPGDWFPLLDQFRDRQLLETGTRPSLTVVIRDALLQLLKFNGLTPGGDSK